MTAYIDAKVPDIRDALERTLSVIAKLDASADSRRVDEATSRIDDLLSLLRVLPELDSTSLRAVAQSAARERVAQIRAGR